MSSPLSIAAIVGRPNVGKSTLFNRLIGRRSALVEKKPGITRDRNYGKARYHGFEFIVVDTGGFEPVAETSLIQKMAQQAQLAVEEADCVLFVVNAQEGWTHADEEIYRTLVEAGRPLFVVVNKADINVSKMKAWSFTSLALRKYSLFLPSIIAALKACFRK